MQLHPYHIDCLVQAANSQISGVSKGAKFEAAADHLGTALRLLEEQRSQQTEQSGDRRAAPSSSSEGGYTQALLCILKACIQSSHPAAAPVTAYLLSHSSSSRDELLAQPQLLADLVAAACAEPQGRSLAPLQEAVCALVQHAGTVLGQTPEFCTALQQQLAGGSRGAGQLLWALIDTQAGRQLVVGQPGVLAAAAKGMDLIARAEDWSLQKGRRPAAYPWAAALVTLVTSDDASAAAVVQHQEMLRDLQHLLVLQLPGEGTLQYEQLQGWELWSEALRCGRLLECWPKQLHGSGISIMCCVSESAARTTHPAAVKAAGAELKVLLSGLPACDLVVELFGHQEVPTSLLQLQGRLEALGDTSLLEGVAALLQRLREEDLPLAAAAYPHWEALFEAAVQLQPGAIAHIVESIRSAGSSIAALCAGVRQGEEPWLQRLAAVLFDGTPHSRQQVLGCRELPWALAHGLTQTPEGIPAPLMQQVWTALLQSPLGQELVCSSRELQEVVVADLQQDGEAVEACKAMGTSAEDRPKAWAGVLTAFAGHPQLLVALLLHGMLPAVEDAHRPDLNAIRIMAAAEGLEAALLTPEGGALDLLLVQGYTDHTARMIARRQHVNVDHDYLPAVAQLLLQWPVNQVLAAVLGRLTSSNSRVVLGALLLLQHLQQVPHQRGFQEDGTSAAARKAAACAVGDAVAAAVRQSMAPAADMADLLRDMQEAAVDLARQHQLFRDCRLPAKHQQQQQQQQQQVQAECQGTATGMSQQPGTRGRKRQATSTAMQQGDAVAQRSSDQQAKKVKRAAGAAPCTPGAAGSSTPVPAAPEDAATGAAAAAGQDWPQEVAPQAVGRPSKPGQQQQQVYQLTVGDVHMVFEMEPLSP